VALPKDGAGLALEREGQGGILGLPAPTYPLPLPPPLPLGLGEGEAKGRPSSTIAARRAPRPDRPSRLPRGGLEEGVHGLGPCTTPSLGCPPKLLLKLDHFSISFGDFSFFL
jgi:hypothetical protein